MNRFVIADPKKCIGCRTCEIACVMAHNGNQTSTLTPENFSPRLKVIKGLSVSTAVLCRQCEDAPCANVCPNGAIVHAKDSIQVIQEKCIGCKTCVVACPFGAMDVISKPAQRMSGGDSYGDCVRAEAHKCDLCIDNPSGPACIKVCPTDALQLISNETIEAMIRKKQERTAFDEAAGMLF